MLHVLFVAGAPIAMAGLKGVFGANDFAFEERSQGCVFGSEACWALAMSVQWGKQVAGLRS